MNEQWKHDLDVYFSKWNEGFKTFESGPIKSFYHDDFVGFWGNSKLSIPDQYGRDYDVEAVLKGMPGAVKTFNILHHAQRAENEVVVTGVLSAAYEGRIYPSQCLYVLRFCEDRWKIMREYIEIES